MIDYRLRDIQIAIDYRAGMTREQVGVKYDMDKERVRQIHQKQIIKALQEAGEQEWDRDLERNFTADDLKYLIEYREFLIKEIEEEKKRGVYKYNMKRTGR